MSEMENVEARLTKATAYQGTKPIKTKTLIEN
jgi:hypothetical protein